MVAARVVIAQAEHETTLPYEPEKQLGWVTVVPVLDPVDSVEVEVALAFLAAADGLAATDLGLIAIDHKTSEYVVPLERELLAVSAATRSRARGQDFDGIEVHYHFLRRDDGKRCDRRVFDRDDLNAAVATLRDAAKRFARMKPFEPLSVHSKTDWDSERLRCDYQAVCARWEGPHSFAMP